MGPTIQRTNTGQTGEHAGRLWGQPSSEHWLGGPKSYQKFSEHWLGGPIQSPPPHSVPPKSFLLAGWPQKFSEHWLGGPIQSHSVPSCVHAGSLESKSFGSSVLAIVARISGLLLALVSNIGEFPANWTLWTCIFDFDLRAAASIDPARWNRPDGIGPMGNPGCRRGAVAPIQCPWRIGLQTLQTPILIWPKRQYIEPNEQRNDLPLVSNRF